MGEVIVLFDGYSEKVNDTTMKANCSCTLIKASKTVIVDTMTAWDRDRIVDALSSRNLSPDEIDYVVSTHSHADHIGNNNLFGKAEHIVGTCVHHGDTFYEDRFTNGEYEICPEIKIIATPGHTYDDVTVLVQANVEGKPCCVAVTGDLFEKEEDIPRPSIWKELGAPELQKVQSQMRARVINLADFIVPGHGSMFRVTQSLRDTVNGQLSE